MRMPKNWTLVGTNSLDFHEKRTREEILKREHKFAKAIRNLPVMKLEQLEKESIDAYNAQTAYMQNLREAKQKGILRSPKLLSLI